MDRRKTFVQEVMHQYERDFHLIFALMVLGAIMFGVFLLANDMQDRQYLNPSGDSYGGERREWNAPGIEHTSAQPLPAVIGAGRTILSIIKNSALIATFLMPSIAFGLPIIEVWKGRNPERMAV